MPPEQITVLGVAKHSIETYLHVLSLLPVKISALLPDFLILPQPEAGQTVIGNICGRLLVRESEFLGYSVDDLALYLDYQTAERNYKITNFSAEQMQSIEAFATPRAVRKFSLCCACIGESQTASIQYAAKSQATTRVFQVIGKPVLQYSLGF